MSLNDIVGRSQNEDNLSSIVHLYRCMIFGH